MGFTFDYELLKTGDVFTHSNASGTTKVDTYVYRIQKLQQRGDISSAVPLTNSGCLVEISSYCSSDKIPESEEEIHSLAEKLVP